jgi:AcrR family transcriptional regulator
MSECILTHMASVRTPGRVLSTAEERRRQVVEAAIPVFADRGFSGTPTTVVAKQAGISHAYLFRLFPKKVDLAIAVVEHCHDRIYEAFVDAAAEAKAAGDDPMQAMGKAYGGLLANRDLVLVQLHSHAAAADDAALREASRRGFARLFALVERESEADSAAVGSFFATGMLMNVMAAVDAAAVDDRWAEVLTDYCLGAA